MKIEWKLYLWEKIVIAAIVILGLLGQIALEGFEIIEIFYYFGYAMGMILFFYIMFLVLNNIYLLIKGLFKKKE